MSSGEFKLPKGVTGFSNEDQSRDNSFATFKSACIEAARRVDGRAKGYVQAGITPNFHQATVTYDDKSLLVVCNGRFKFVAFAEAKNSATLEFIDEARFAKSFMLQGYKVLDSALLLKPLHEHNCAELHETELDQIEYWRSKTIGEVIFNWYD